MVTETLLKRQEILKVRGILKDDATTFVVFSTRALFKTNASGEGHRKTIRRMGSRRRRSCMHASGGRNADLDKTNTNKDRSCTLRTQ